MFFFKEVRTDDCLAVKDGVTIKSAKEDCARVLGEVVSFLLWVQEAPGSNPGGPLFTDYSRKKVLPLLYKR